MHIKRIVGPLGLMSRVAQQQEQLWRDLWQEPHQLCSAALGVFLRTIPQHSLSGRQTLEAQTQGLGDGSRSVGRAAGSSGVSVSSSRHRGDNACVITATLQQQHLPQETFARPPAPCPETALPRK